MDLRVAKTFNKVNSFVRIQKYRSWIILFVHGKSLFKIVFLECNKH